MNFYCNVNFSLARGASHATDSSATDNVLRIFIYTKKNSDRLSFHHEKQCDFTYGSANIQFTQAHKLHRTVHCETAQMQPVYTHMLSAIVQYGYFNGSLYAIELEKKQFKKFVNKLNRLSRDHLPLRL